MWLCFYGAATKESSRQRCYLVPFRATLWSCVWLFNFLAFLVNVIYTVLKSNNTLISLFSNLQFYLFIKKREMEEDLEEIWLKSNATTWHHWLKVHQKCPRGAICLYLATARFTFVRTQLLSHHRYAPLVSCSMRSISPCILYTNWINYHRSTSKGKITLRTVHF